MARADGFRERGLAVTRLETFVDAAFAFALTLLVISTSDQRPQTYAELVAALHRVPTFLACFALIATFWAGHERFSRRFGIEDRSTIFLSMALVASMLVWVYPLRMVISSGLQFMSGGWVPSELEAQTIAELQSAFRIFAVGFIVLNGLLLLLHRHALQRAEALELSPRERLETRAEIQRHAIQIGAALLSFAITYLVAGSHTPWVVGLPGFAYFSLSIAFPLHFYWLTRARAAL